MLRTSKPARLLVLLLMLSSLLSLPEGRAGTDSADHFVILLYHHVDDDTPPSTSVRPKRFAEHLDWLEDQGYRVWPLQRALQALANAELPDRIVVITFDDAYRSVYNTAWPMLAEREMPFSVFVNTDAIDAGNRPYMNWSELRQLSEAGVELGNHSASHAHLPRRNANEDQAAWLRRVAEDVDRAHRRIEQQTGQVPAIFAWPYGEDADELVPLIAERYRYALAQRSGAVGRSSEVMALPRFPLASGWDSIERLQLAVGARPLPVLSAEIRPKRHRGAVSNPDHLALNLAEVRGFEVARIRCYSAAGDALPVDLVSGSKPPVLIVDLAGFGRPGRNKANCTAPVADGSGDYYWYSFQWLQPRADGSGPSD